MQVHRDIMDGRYRGGAVRRRAASTPGCRPRRASRTGVDARGPVLHRRRRGRQGRRADRPLLASSAGSATSRSTRSIERAIVWPNTPHQPGGRRPRLDPRPPLPHRPQRRSSTTASCSATSPSSPTTAGSRRCHAINPDIFKAYDVRGLYPGEINEEAARADRRGVRRVPRARSGSPSAATCGCRRRRWPRRSSTARATQGADVVDYGMIGTDMLYFAVATRRARRRRADHRVAQSRSSTTA